jgi:hypothetical protein
MEIAAADREFSQKDRLEAYLTMFSEKHVFSEIRAHRIDLDFSLWGQAGSLRHHGAFFPP